MADATSVDIFNPTDDLLEEFASFGFFELFTLDDVIEELSTAGVLHDEEELSGRFNDLFKAISIGQLLGIAGEITIALLTS